MCAMDNTGLRYVRTSHAFPSMSLKQRRSGYEPSDTETDWKESPNRDQNRSNSGVFSHQNPKMDLDSMRDISPMKLGRQLSSRFNPRKDVNTSSNGRRYNSKSPYKVRKEDGRAVSPMSVRRNISPFSKSELRRQVSPFKSAGQENDEIISSNRRRNQRTPTRDERGSFYQNSEVSRASERSNHTRRAVTAPRQRPREKDQENNPNHRETKAGRTPSPMSTNRTDNQKERDANSPLVGEINELVANIKKCRSPILNPPDFESTESISPGDIFFSREHRSSMMQKNGLTKYGKDRTNSIPKPPKFTQINSAIPHVSSKTSGIMMNSSSRTSAITSSTLSGQISGKFSTTNSSKFSHLSRTTSDSLKKFTENRKKSQADSWFSCMSRGPCRTRNSSPKKSQFNESSFIEKAFVVESLRKLWADKHQPKCLNDFICHKQEAQILNEFVSYDNVSHILLKGPSGSGKRSLAIAFLREIFGDSCRNISHDLKYLQVQEDRARQVIVPITSSVHHVELDVNQEPNAKYALMSSVKEISHNYAQAPEVSIATFRPDFKVLVLYQVDKASENIQHLIKWIMDCYSDACKLILCCEDETKILDSVTNRCKVIKVDAPVTHEVMEVLIQIARKEDFDLPMNFAAKIAAKSKQNLRKAIMALEACKSHNYPFADDQPIPSGWEDVLIELAAEILADPSQKRLFIVRGKFQKLLVDFIHPKLILLKLVEQFLKGVHSSSRRDLYYWHAYYEKRMPTGSSALLKLEEFVAKFMSLHRKNSIGQYEQFN